MGGGANQLFPPHLSDKATASDSLRHLLARPPEQCGQSGSRWKLATIGAACDWLKAHSPSGVWRLLEQLGLSLKRGRDYLHSPDPHYVEKLADIVACFEQARLSNGRIVLLFGDELTYYRQPSIARDWVAVSSKQPLARRSLHRNSTARVISALNGLTGQTTSLQASKIGVAQLVKFYQQLRNSYPQAEVIYLVEDNWPVHFHPDVLAALEPQRTRFELRVSRSWPSEPGAKAKRLNLPIQILPLPTYASWTNPIEKLWRWLKAEVLHLHRYAEQWNELKRRVNEFLEQFKTGSQELLRYVGLTVNSNLYGSLFQGQTAPG